jgi:hypothetical protein
MATRLYPQPYSTRSLEILAGVPEGTHKRLRALEEKHPNRRTSDAASRRWNKALEHDADLSRLDTFLSDGWGGINAEVLVLVERCGFKNGVGQVKLLKDPMLVASLMSIKGVPDDMLLHVAGVAWY